MREAHDSLQHEGDVRDEAEFPVHRVEVGRRAVVELVVLNNYETCDQSEDAGGVEEGMQGCASSFLLGSVRWLEDQDALRYEEQAGGVEKLWKTCQQVTFVTVSNIGCGVCTGCAEKSISSELNTAAQTITVRTQMPPWASTPVPVPLFSGRLREENGFSIPDHRL